jgi:hypothetical protein
VIDILQAHVLAEVSDLARRFQSAEPFPHVVIDDFLREDVVDTLLAQFPPFERGNSTNEAGLPGLKSTFERVAELGAGFTRVDRLVQAPEFLSFLGRLTGIEGLLYDPAYVGGGTHENRPGQALDPHVDFNYHPATGWHRRLNLLLYLNREWREEWGGCLELHRDAWNPDAAEVRTILPLRNRCVIFETSERSWHGFLPITPPVGRTGLTRRSLALYFYTRERPPEQTAPAHATVYVERPLPPLSSEEPLAADAYAQVEELTTRRHQHLDRLFRREQQVLARVRERLMGALEPGTAPAADVVSALARLVHLEDEALQALYRREIELAKLVESVESQDDAFGVEAPLALAAPVIGAWKDGWVGRHLRLRLRAAQPVSGLVVHGSLPAMAPPDQELTIHVRGSVAALRVGAGDFDWIVPLALPPGTSTIEITASAGFCPRDSGASADGRELAWILRAIGAAAMPPPPAT